MLKYLQSRFYVRGLSLLGLFNTFTSAIANRVLVLHKDDETGKIVGWHIAKGTDFPPVAENS